jgi:prepilin-type N-terminal cleavage/methylation domain-containing protein
MMQKGFTMVEILITLAIIGVLAGVIFVAIGNQRQKARISAVMSTAKSSLGFVQVCKFKGWDLQEPSPLDGSASDDVICSGSTSGDDSLEEWAEITIEDCEYSDITPDSWDYAIDCTGAGIGKVKCSASDGSCEWN